MQTLPRPRQPDGKGRGSMPNILAAAHRATAGDVIGGVVLAVATIALCWLAGGLA